MPDTRARRRDTWVLHLMAILLPSLMIATSSLLQLHRDYSLVRSELRGLSQLTPIQDQLEAELGLGPAIRVPAGIDEIARIGDESGLVLDPDLDSYHLMQSLVEIYPDELAAVRCGSERQSRFVAGFTAAAKYDEANRGGHPAEAAAVAAALQNYQEAAPATRLAALGKLRQAGSLWLGAMVERRGRQLLVHHGLIFSLALIFLIGGLVLLRRQINRDSRDRQILEQALREAHAGEQAKSRFLAGISHELRTPLNGVAGQLQLLLMDEAVPERRAALRVASVCSDQLLTLLNDLIDQVKSEKRDLVFHPVDFDAASFFADVRQVFHSAAAAKGLTLEAQWEDLPARLNSDTGRLRQVLFHLLDNAVKFTNQGKIELRIECRDNLLRIEITDDGPGLPVASSQSLFTLFNGTPGQGVGIGLANCHRLVSLAGGEIGAGNCDGRGARFWVNWPVRLRPVSSHDLTEQDLSRLKILAVEDNPVNRQVLSALLRKLGVTHLRLAEDGLEALKQVALEAPDLILMDCLMPKMDGFEATRELRSRGYLGPIIALTANAETSECLACGMSGHMAKPLRLDLLKELLRQTLPLRQTS